MDCKELLDLTCLTVANMIKGMDLSHTGSFVVVMYSPVSRLIVLPSDPETLIGLKSSVPVQTVNTMHCPAICVYREVSRQAQVSQGKQPIGDAILNSVV